LIQRELSLFITTQTRNYTNPLYRVLVLVVFNFLKRTNSIVWYLVSNVPTSSIGKWLMNNIGIKTPKYAM
jgi:hypothetical protein